MNIYIQAASQISFQQPLCEEWMTQPISPKQAFNEPLEADYKQFITPAESRRMGKLLKRAVAVSLNTLAKGGCAMPDAIISGTGLGCVENTEKFLNALIDNNEECLPPTPFMQSTHNTISSQIALKLQCHGYNSTYSHLGTSFDSALLDAVLQFEMQQIETALVGGYDEITPAYFKMLDKLGYWRKEDVTIAKLKKIGTSGAIAGDAAVSVLLSNNRNQNTLCQLVDIDIFTCKNLQELPNRCRTFLQKNHHEQQQIDAVMCGFSGDDANDSVYNTLIEQEFPDTPALWYKHLFGESFCSSGYGIYAAATCLKMGQNPDILCYNLASKNISKLSNILVINHFQKKDYSLTLLSV